MKFSNRLLVMNGFSLACFLPLSFCLSLFH